MSDELRATLRQIVLEFGIDIDVQITDEVEMLRGIFELKHYGGSEQLADYHRRALLENLRRAIRKTAAFGYVPAIVAQSLLPRWRFLRGCSPAAADAYVAVLRYFEIEVPDYLEGDWR